MRIDGQLSLPLQYFRAIQPDLAEDFAGGEPLIGREQDEISFLNFKFGNERLFFGLAEKLHNG